MKTQLVIGLLVLAVITLLSTTTAQSVQFVKDWETALYPYDPHLSASMCVDSSHNVHVVTNAGLWSTLDPSGKLIRKTEDETLQDANSVACILSTDRIVVAVPHTNHLYIFSGDHQRLSSVTVPDGFRGVVSADDKLIRLLAPQQGYIFKQIDLKTGATIGLLGSLSQNVIPYGPQLLGDALMDEKSGLLLFVTRNPEIVSAFDGNGKLMFSKPIVGDVRQQDYGVTLDVPGAPTTKDRAFGMFRLDDDRYLVNINRVDIAEDRKHATSDLEYQILDGQFNIVGHASPNEIGSICASDGQGTVYSFSGGRMLTIAKAHLQ